MWQWVKTVYEKLVRVDAKIAKQPVPKAINKAGDKIVGPLFK